MTKKYKHQCSYWFLGEKRRHKALGGTYKSKGWIYKLLREGDPTLGADIIFIFPINILNYMI